MRPPALHRSLPVTTSPAPILRFHAAGDWAPHSVEVTRAAAGPRPTPPEVAALVESAWAEAVARPGVHLFDGPMCRLDSWSATPECLTLTLSETTYKRFLGTNLAHPELADRYGRDVLANPVGVSPALLTADGYLMMGRRNASVAYYPNRIHPFAGALDPADADPFAAVRRELNEELGLTEADVPEVRCTGIAEDLSIRQPELIFLARTTRTRGQVEAALDRTEHDASWAAASTRADVDRLLEGFSDGGADAFTPVAIASLLLFGRRAFGVDWFARRLLTFAA
jgi:8-oxo-dGTP pyrophosphatase MutT (NUDIX family)